MTADEDVARLVREQRLTAAASLASARGDAKTASELFERACEWQKASSEALAAGDPARATRLAILARDDVLAESALRAMADRPDACARVAEQLERQGEPAWAARAYEAAGRKLDAARAWERAGDAVRAAVLLEAERDVVGAARVLEAATRRAPAAWAAHVALGGLLFRYGKDEAAVRALQAVPEGAPERPSALVPLIAALERLGLGQALHEARAELARTSSPGLGRPGPFLPRREPRRAGGDGPRRCGPTDVRTSNLWTPQVREVASTARASWSVDTVRGDRVVELAGHAIGGAG